MVPSCCRERYSVSAVRPLIRSLQENEKSMATRNSRIGMVLFLVYLALYGGFVFLNAFAADVMELQPLAGVNLAILYGFGLIVAALVLALIYGLACTSADEEPASHGGDK
jgi:uncharacterized membrane protein (DUF485 family)